MKANNENRIGMNVNAWDGAGVVKYQRWLCDTWIVLFVLYNKPEIEQTKRALS